MSARRAQSSMEYIMVIISLLIILLSLYVVVVDMDLRRSIFTSQMEGDRIAARLGRAIDHALIIGSGATLSIPLDAYPNQTLLAVGSQVVAQGSENRTFAIVQTLAARTTATGRFRSNQDVLVSNDGTNITVTPSG